MKIEILVPFVTLLGVIFTALVGFLTWSKNLKYQILKDERDRLEKKAELVLELYKNAIFNNSINAKLASLVLIEFPKNVSDEFNKTVEDRVMSSEDIQLKKEAFFRMAYEISLAIKEYDNKILRNAQVVDLPFAKNQFIEIVKTIPQYIKFF